MYLLVWCAKEVRVAIKEKRAKLGCELRGDEAKPSVAYDVCTQTVTLQSDKICDPLLQGKALAVIWKIVEKETVKNIIYRNMKKVWGNQDRPR